MSRAKRVRTGNRRSRKALLATVPKVLSSEEVQTRIEEAYEQDNKEQLTIPLDALGRKKEAFYAKRRVTIMEDSLLPYPELYLNVFIFGPEAGGNFNKMFARAKCYKSDTPDDADLVVFTGSSHDIDPQLYGENIHPSVKPNLNHTNDRSAFTLYSFCKTRGIPMFGVCGGMQLLHVANGGKLYQHVDGHQGAHSMWDERDKSFIERVSSVHHQLCMKNEGMEILGSSHVSKERWLNDRDVDKTSNRDIEAFFYRETCCTGVQGHPEYSGYPKYTVWCLQQLDRNLNENPDLSYRPNDTKSSRLRIKQEILDELRAKKGITVTIPDEQQNVINVEPIKG